jgi:ATP-dependent protease HslVU (ClpYQ) peptidase subunit
MCVDDMSAEEVAKRAMDVASDMCVHTNKEFLSFTMDDVGKHAEKENKSE